MAASARLHARAASQAGLANAIDLDALATDLRGAIAGEVRFDAGSRALYATDASNYRRVPLGVVVPRDADDVVAAVAIARRHDAPILGRGAGTSLAGQCCNAGIVLDFSKYMNRIVDIDPQRRTARIEPGVVLDDLRAAAARHNLTFGPDPATHAYCTLGGMIGNNSCGVRSVMSAFYGPGPTTADNVEAMEILTYDGLRANLGPGDPPVEAGDPLRDLFRRLASFRDRYEKAIREGFPRIPRRVSGYNLPALLPENGFNVARSVVGSESTLALVLGATVRLIPVRPHRVLIVLGFEDVFAAADRVPEVMSYKPVGLEGFDDRLAADLRRTGLDAGNLRLLPDGRGWLLVEFGADSPEEALKCARLCAGQMRRAGESVSVSLFDKREDQHKLWEIRESGLAQHVRRVTRSRGSSPSAATWPTIRIPHWSRGSSWALRS